MEQTRKTKRGIVMTDDLVKRLRMDIEPSEGDMESAADLIEAQAARIAELEAALRVYECSGKCANCYGAIRDTKYCGQIARAVLEGGKDG